MEIQKYYDMALTTAASYGPKIVAALAILALAWIVATMLSRSVAYVINKTSLGARSRDDGQDIGKGLGTALFWLTILIALPAILGALGLEGLLSPMQAMAEKFLGFLPNLVGAGLIFGIGWVVATVVRRALTSILQAAQVDKLADRVGLDTITGETGVSNFAGVLVFTLLIIPVAIAALDALAIEAVSAPAKQMLANLLEAIPNIFAAAIVLLLAFLIGRFALEALSKLLPTLGFDKIGQRVGLTKEILGKSSPSRIAGGISFFAIMVFGLIEAAKLLNFAIVSDLLTHVLALGGHILLGSVIIAFGVMAADFIAGIIAKSKGTKPMAGFLKVAIIILATAMGLRQMGLANEIINTGFTLLMGALALGAAIAIGWGGKDTAGRLLEKWTKSL